MNTRPGISLYNQDRLSEKEFVDNFVARKTELETLLDELRAIADGAVARHAIVIGARGMGKSSMLRRIAIAVNQDSVLHKAFIALSFREEQYNVISLDAFWRNCSEALADWCENNGYDSIADEIDEAIESEEWRDSEKSEQEFLAYCARVKRRAVLLLDNLDIILDGLKPKDHWSLRRVLQAEGGPIAIGGSAKLLQQGADRSAPFYEFFFPHFLDALSELELLVCLRALADRQGDPGMRVKKILNDEPGRIKTLYNLTGGNPRVLNLIYLILERSETESIFADLEALLDQVTPFYKARIEEYQTPQQRAVIDAIALNWNPISSRKLAEATGIEITTISSQLGRLRKDGLVEEVDSSGKKLNYQLAERFLNIWYLMRHGTRRTRNRLKWLALFMARLFSPEEIDAMAKEAHADNHDCAWAPDYREAVLAAHEIMQESKSLSGDAVTGTDPTHLDIPESEAILEAPWKASFDVAFEHIAKGMFSDALTAINDALSRAEEASDTDARIIARLLSYKAYLLGELHQHQLALSTLEDTIARFNGNDSLLGQQLIAWASVNKGVALGKAGRAEDAIAAYEDVVARFSNAEATALQEQVARAIVNKGVALGKAGRTEDAIAASEDVVTRFSNAEATALQEQVARAIVNKGVALGQIGRTEDAIAAYEDVVARFSNAEATALQEQVAWAIVNKGVALGKAGRTEDEIAAYEDVVTRFSNAEATALQEQVAWAIVNKGVALGQIGRTEDAIAASEDVVTRFSNAEATALQEQVAKASVNKGVALGKAGRAEDAIAAYEDVVARFSNAEATALQEQVARAIVNKGVALGQIGRTEDAIAASEDVVTRFSNAEATALQEQVAKASVNKGVALGKAGRAEDAIAAYEDVVARFSNAEATALQEQVARAIVNKGVALGQIGRTEDAIAAYEDVVARFSNAEATALQEQVAWAIVNKGVALGQIGRTEDEIAAYEDVVARFSNAEATALQEQVAWAIVNKGVALGKAGRTEDEIAAYEDVVTRFSNAEATALQEQVAKASVNKGVALGKAGRAEDAIAAYEDVVARFSNAEATGLQEQVARAIVNKGGALGQIGRTEDVRSPPMKTLSPASPMLKRQASRSRSQGRSSIKGVR